MPACCPWEPTTAWWACLSLGDIATQRTESEAAQALCGISRPGGEHSQRQEF